MQYVLQKLLSQNSINSVDAEIGDERSSSDLRPMKQELADFELSDEALS
jgi:hypothetical protein